MQKTAENRRETNHTVYWTNASWHNDIDSSSVQTIYSSPRTWN